MLVSSILFFSPGYVEDSTDRFSVNLFGFRSCVSQEFRFFLPDFLETFVTEQTSDSDTFPDDQ